MMIEHHTQTTQTLTSAARTAVMAPPSTNPYDRKTDIDGPLGVDTNEGGASAIADWTLGGHTLTSISAWRFWNWAAENGRDYTCRSAFAAHPLAPGPVQPGAAPRTARRGAGAPENDIVRFVKTGRNQHGVVYGSMAEAFNNSTQFLSDPDLRAIAH